MLGYIHKNWDFLLTLGNASLGGWALTLPWDKALTFLFITIPVGVWSWYRLIDYLKARNAKKPNGSTNDRSEAL